MAAPALTASRVDNRSRFVLPLACASIVPVLMNYTSPLVSLPETAAGVGAGPVAQTWLMNASPLGLAAALLVAGTLADNFGRRRLLLWGLLGTAGFSVAAGLSGTAGVLIAARIGQGAAGAAIIAASLGIIGSAYTEPGARGRATGWWASSLSAGLVVGPVVTGALTADWGWSAVYWVYALVAAGLAAATGLLAESRAGTRRSVHYGGVLAFVTAMAGLIALLTVARTGWWQSPVLVLAALVAVALVVFVVLSLRHHSPMVDLRLFSRLPFLLSVMGSGFNGLLMIGVISVLPTAWQHAHHLTALQVAAPFTLYPLAALVTARLSRHVRLPPARLLALGYGLSLAQLLLLGTVTEWSLAQALPAYLIAGIGSGFANSANARMAVDSVPAEAAAMGSGAANTARYVGSAMGVAIGIALVGGLGWAVGIDAFLVASAALLAAATVGYAVLGGRRASLA